MTLRQRALFFAAFGLLGVDAFLPTSQHVVSSPRAGIGRQKFHFPTKIHPDTSTSTSSALEASPAAAAVAAAITPPSLKAVALACLLPTLLGFYKSEYGVSYAYGTAVATVAFLTLRAVPVSTVLSLPSTSIAAFHASAVFFYGIRLNLFLLYREICVPRFAKMRERIEERAVARGSRLQRTPFILSCALLYGFMTAPLLVVAKLCGTAPLLNGKEWPHLALLGSVGLTWGGFLLGAVGDLHKSVVKAKKGDDHLVTGGVFKFFRHPNYTGEVIGWTANCVAAFCAVLSSGSGWHHWKPHVPYLAASIAGCLGIGTVLSAATTNLEKRQQEQYGETEKYQAWVRSSWGGVFVKDKKNASSDAEEDVEKGIELDISDEAEGTGI